MESVRIAEADLFQGILPADCADLCRVLGVRERTYEKGELLLRRGQTARTAGVVLTGRVRMEAASPAGEPQVMGWAGEGSSFAEAYAVLGDRALLVDVVAAEACAVAWIDVPALWALAVRAGCDGSPDRGDICRLHRAAAALQHNLVRVVAERSVRLSQRSFHRAPRTVRGRLLAFFSTQDQDADGWVRLGVTQGELAGYLGVNRSVLSAELAAMARDGLLQRDGRRVRLV